MDTRFWGPDGWKLLHSIAEGFPDNPSDDIKNIYTEFFGCLKYILPCIYCRNSFAEFTEKLKINTTSKDTLIKWLYDIHNMVNDKLRKQGFLNDKDPDFNNIKKQYHNYVIDINNTNCVNMPGWDFIYSIVFNYPLQIYEFGEDIQSRLKGYATFLLLLKRVIPFNIKSIFYDFFENIDVEECLYSSTNIKILIYNLEKYVKEKINCKCISFSDRCNYIDKYKAGCKKNTCRAL